MNQALEMSRTMIYVPVSCGLVQEIKQYCGLSSTILEIEMMVLLMEMIYAVGGSEWLRCHDICVHTVHTVFHKDRLGYSKVVLGGINIQTRTHTDSKVIS
jgi:hypothetical protein